MTDLATPPTAPSAPRAVVAGPTPPQPRSRRSRRGGIAVVMAASLALSGVARFWADHQRTKDLPTTGEVASSTTSLSSMNSFALGLLLGGLRGPLVMILWTDSENQKNGKNLEGVDTEIEWIRLLQPEFDTVHLFQIWNKAYNISVQMASLANKYDTILGALDYAHSVDAQKPNDINIVATVGQLFFDKLGTSSEKAYYRRRVREESKPHAVDTAAQRADIGWRRVTLDPILDDHFNVLPALGGDRGEFRYLDTPRYGPYTDGVSTFGYAYNYYKRSEQLVTVDHQHHDQLSDVVIDSRPALSLKNWADDELQQARRREAQAFGAPFADEPATVDGATADVTLDQRAVDPSAVALALADYDRVTRLCPDALTEYERHIRNYPDRAQQYRLYMAELMAEGQAAEGDRDFLQALATPPGGDRDRLLTATAQAYVRSTVGYDLILMRHYTDDRDLAKVLPPGYGLLPTNGQQEIERMSPEQVLAAEAAIDRAYAGPRNDDPNADRFEYLAHTRRMGDRLRTIALALRGKAPTTAPTSAP